jgi:hypothetical protein
LLPCHDLNVWDGISHRELWPSVLDDLKGLWDRAHEPLKRRLGDHYYALPRGRVTRPKGRYAILHGRDSPAPGLREIVFDRFRLHRFQVRTPRDGHERALRDDVLALEDVLGIGLSLPAM